MKSADVRLERLREMHASLRMELALVETEIETGNGQPVNLTRLCELDRRLRDALDTLPLKTTTLLVRPDQKGDPYMAFLKSVPEMPGIHEHLSIDGDASAGRPSQSTLDVLRAEHETRQAQIFARLTADDPGVKLQATSLRKEQGLRGDVALSVALREVALARSDLAGDYRDSSLTELPCWHDVAR